MALVEQNQPSTGGFTTSSKTLADGWRRLGRIATFVALLGAPSVFLWAYIAKDWGFLWSLLFTIGAVAVVRGLIDVILRKFVPWPTLYGDDSEKRREADALDRQRWWFWSRKLRFAIWVVVIITSNALTNNLRNTIAAHRYAIKCVGNFHGALLVGDDQ
jgi:hypothetical protein